MKGEYMMHPVGYMVVAGMLIAVVGMGHLGENARPLAWGLAVAIGVLVHWVNSLQNQINELKRLQKSEEETED